MWLEVAALTILSFISILFLQTTRKDPEKIFGVYSRPGKWFLVKYLAFLTPLEIKRAKLRVLRNLKKHEPEADSSEKLENLDRLQQISEGENDFDSVSFQAATTDGYYLCGGIERSHSATSFGFFYIAVPGLGLLSSEKLPSTTLKSEAVSVYLQNAYSAEGICFAPVKAMKAWKVTFSGRMKSEENPKHVFDVKLVTDWISEHPHFSYDENMNSKALARAVARERWTKHFFKQLKTYHRTYYNQIGYLTGTLTINGGKHQLTNFPALRSHNFGYRREWTSLHRYASFVIYLQNKTTIVLDVISHTPTTSHLEIGYMMNRNKQFDSIENCDLQLYQHGEKGTPGKTLAFSFKTADKVFTVKAVINFEAQHYKGHSNEAKFIQQFANYNVNGVEGKGFTEWYYKN